MPQVDKSTLNGDPRVYPIYILKKQIENSPWTVSRALRLARASPLLKLLLVTWEQNPWSRQKILDFKEIYQTVLCFGNIPTEFYSSGFRRDLDPNGWSSSKTPTWHSHSPSSILRSTLLMVRLQSPFTIATLYLPGKRPTGWEIISVKHLDLVLCCHLREVIPFYSENVVDLCDFAWTRSISVMLRWGYIS